MDPQTLLEQTEFVRIIDQQLRIHTSYQATDFYKLIHQMACGPSHVSDYNEARLTLEKEWKTLGRVQKGEMLLEMIGPGADIMRVNLRLYRKTGGSVEALFPVFRQSAESCTGDPGKITLYWDWLLQLADEEELPVSKEDLAEFGNEMRELNYPAVHHSDEYVEANDPSYRVVLKNFWEGFTQKPPQ